MSETTKRAAMIAGSALEETGVRYVVITLEEQGDGLAISYVHNFKDLTAMRAVLAIADKACDEGETLDYQVIKEGVA